MKRASATGGRVRIALLALLLNAVCPVGKATAENERDDLTLNQIYTAGITSLVGVDISIVSRVTWSNWPQGNALPAKLHQTESLRDSLVATPIALDFRDADRYIEDPFKNQGNGHIFLVSDDLTTNSTANRWKNTTIGASC